MAKFMISLAPLVYEKLKNEADERGITVQDLLRAVIIPEHYKPKRSKRQK